MTKLMRLFPIALVAFALPTALFAQAPTPTPAPPAEQQVSPEVQSWFVELQQISARLSEIQARALQDPQLQAAQQALGTEVKQAMDEVDPGLPAAVERVAGLEQEAVAAQEAGNEAKLEELAREAQQIQSRFIAAQTQALQRPALAARVDAFQTQLERRMVEIEPEARGLIERLRELEEKLQSAMQPAAG